MNLIKKLLRTVLWAQKSSFYRERLKREKIKVNAIKTLSNFQKLPPITAQDLREHSKEFSSVSRDKIYSLYATGGTTGKSKLIYWTEEALENSAKAMANYLRRLFSLKGKLCIVIAPSDNLAIVGDFERKVFRNMNALIGSMGLTFTDDQRKQLITVMQAEEPYLLMGNPGRVLSLIQDFVDANVDTKKLGIKYVISGSEILTPKTRDFIEKAFGATVFDHGGMTEVGGTTIECRAHDGQHVFESVVYAEVLNLETGEVITEGIGELCFTTLINPAFPLVRYKTEDIVKITHKKCSCGLKTPRIWYKCRISESVSLFGATLYAYQVDEALEEIKELTSAYNLRVESVGPGVTMTLVVECQKEFQHESYTKKILQALKERIPKLNTALGSKKMNIVISFVDPETLKRTPRGKIANRILDARS
ncbi:MAG: hypothetical protein A3D65_05855 [Candidatus Lloydbacteria bacterium RIFCSPHIGHO2_02_FULL_50_13]|uniref:AMP-dependent synthetase/ligase domain-containing protein n=1 Tax=Candidatus Lloydbacteria bacterium RIFCSPHIGHO2_02_FULL_50_13 TaxID=1798661 RepID=A0A1G2D8P3_9BACT|nr:MAG: hypothetical protein A3D65_05855 [Candidatus Lloydbacteria bacterium RIFCSPHIGHO2_02_FULL_50_13]